jgi:Fe-S cluster biosynthesis and repair protein YggX
MSLKFNVNKIHSDLSSSFEEVEISEKSSLKWGNHIELLINENKVQLRAIISKRNLENKDFNWAYFSNPEDDHPMLIHLLMM